MTTPDIPASAVVQARSVVKRYGNTVALAGIDVDIGPGITGLLGSNGAGKTTFLSLVLGLRSRNGGTLRVLGEDPATAGIAVRARIGYSSATSPRCTSSRAARPCSGRTTRSGSSGSARSGSGTSARCRPGNGSA